MKKIVTTPDAPAIGPYSPATIYNGTIYVSGQIPTLPGGELCSGSIAEQVTLVMSKIGDILKAGGSDFSKLLKVNILLTDMADFAAVNEAYAKFFESDPPARMCYQVCALPKGAKVEIDALGAV